MRGLLTISVIRTPDGTFHAASPVAEVEGEGPTITTAVEDWAYRFDQHVTDLEEGKGDRKALYAWRKLQRQFDLVPGGED